MTATYQFTLRGMQHSRQIGDSSVTMIATVTLVDANGLPLNWSPWTNPVSLTAAGFPAVGQTLKEIAPGESQTAHWLFSLYPFASWDQDYRIRQIDWSAVVDGKGHSVWEARIHATGHRIYCPEPQTQRSDVMKSRTVDRYRKSTPSSTTDPYDEATGDPTEIAGKPEKFQVSQIAITLTLLWWTDTAGFIDGYPRLDTLIGDRLNKVNSAAFLGFPVHSVMLVGADVQPVRDETVRVSFQFLYDAWYHFDQEPLLDLDQRPKIDLDTGTPPLPRCETVFWIDRSAGTNDLTTLLDARELAWAQFGWKEWTSACGGNQESFTSQYELIVQEPLTDNRTAVEEENGNGNGNGNGGGEE